MTDKPEEGPLNDVARAIGTTLGQAKVQADQVLEGMKAVAKAGAQAVRRAKRKKKTSTRSKSSRAKSKSTRASARGKKKSRRRKSR